MASDNNDNNKLHVVDTQNFTVAAFRCFPSYLLTVNWLSYGNKV